MKNCQTTKSWHFPGRNSLKLSYCNEDKLFKLYFLNKCILDEVFVLFCFKKTFRPKKKKVTYLRTFFFKVCCLYCGCSPHIKVVLSSAMSVPLQTSRGGVSFRYSSNGIASSCGWQEDISEADGRKTMAINENSRLFTTLYAVQIDFQRTKEIGVGWQDSLLSRDMVSEGEDSSLFYLKNKLSFPIARAGFVSTGHESALFKSPK